MKKYLIALMFVISALSTVNASTVVSYTAEGSQTEYITFAFDGGDLSIDVLASGWTGGLTGYGLDDSIMALFVDDGSTYGNLTGAEVGYNDDSWQTTDGSTSGLDSYLSFASLDAGNYVLAVDRYNCYVDCLRVGSDTRFVSPYLDYQLTFTGDVSGVTQVSAVPVPAAAWLFGSALLGFFGFSRKKANA